jgi:hypothetical protein
MGKWTFSFVAYCDRKKFMIGLKLWQLDPHKSLVAYETGRKQ